MKVKIEVTQQDIENGDPEDVHSCPIALAIYRAIDFTGNVEVYDETIRIDYDNDESVVYQNNNEVKAFIKDFDTENVVKPFSFTLGEV